MIAGRLVVIELELVFAPETLRFGDVGSAKAATMAVEIRNCFIPAPHSMQISTVGPVSILVLDIKLIQLNHLLVLLDAISYGMGEIKTSRPYQSGFSMGSTLRASN